MDGVVDRVSALVEEACRAPANRFGYGIWTHHIRPMIPIAAKLAAEAGADEEIVTLAVLLHDYAGIADPAKIERHHEHGAAEAQRILEAMGVPQPKIDRVKRCILAHRGSVPLPKATPEERCVADADAVVHMSEAPSLFHAAYAKLGMGTDEGSAWVRGKWERDWAKLSPPGRRMAAMRYRGLQAMFRAETAAGTAPGRDAVRDVRRILDGLRVLGVRSGDCLIVHSSFKSLGLRDGSPDDALEAILEAVGPEGTVVMPAFTYSYSGIRGVEPFDPSTTPGCGNGVLTERLRLHAGAVRSAHPTHSVAAVGLHARAIASGRETASPLGTGSSFEEALRLGCRILLLGVGNDRNSMLHYAEVKAALPYNDIPFRAFWGSNGLVAGKGSPIDVPLVPEFPGCSVGFAAADGYLAAEGITVRGAVCAADCTLMDGQAMVEAVVARLRRQPDWLLCDDIACEPCSLRRLRLAERGYRRGNRRVP